MTMTCPVDDTELAITQRAGIEIDWCPACRGVWLDRGELDKILARSAEAAPAAPRRNRAAPLDDDPDDARPRVGFDDDRDDDDERRPKGRRRRGLLDDLFDFG